MSAKKSDKPSIIPESIVITEEDKKLPEYKALLRRKEELKKKAEMAAKLPEVLKVAGEKFDKEFKTLNAFVNFVAKLEGKKGGKGKRAKKLTDEQKAQIRQLKTEGKTAAEIKKAVGCSTAQVTSTLYAAKK
jgi:hypothetical protein